MSMPRMNRKADHSTLLSPSDEFFFEVLLDDELFARDEVFVLDEDEELFRLLPLFVFAAIRFTYQNIS